MRCFFNLAGAVYNPDNEGVELADFPQARREAARFIGQYIKDDPDIIWAGEEVRVEVTNADRLILFTVIVFGIDAPAALS